MDRSHNTPIICCGCSKLASEIDKVSKLLSFDGNYPNYTRGIYGDLIDSISESESELNNAARIDEVIDKTTDMLENSSNVKSIALLNTLGIGHQLPALLLSEIKDNFPELSIVSILLAPTGGVSGLSSLNSLVTSQAVMEYSDSVMIKETDETQLFLSSEVTGSTAANLLTHTLGDIHHYMASDIFVALSSHWGAEEPLGNSFLWPSDVCTSRRKLFDVRSSLWRFLRQSSKSKTTFNHLRAVSSSVHALHLWHNTHSQRGDIFVNSATIVDLKVDRIRNCMAVSNSTIPSSDVAASLEWAAPKVPWPSSLGTASYRDTASGVLVKTVRSRPNSSPSVVEKNTKTAQATEVTPDTSLVALSFESPYARIFLSNLCDSAQKLLSVGAFANRFESSHGCSYEDLDFCLESLRYSHCL